MVEEPAAPHAGALLGQNYPNPFNPTTTIEFSLPANSHADVRVYNILGQQMRVLMDRDLPAGTYQVVWDGTDSRARPVASGMYFYCLETAGFRASKKMVLLK
jgi:flagellar hook assembly protein FlgD